MSKFITLSSKKANFLKSNEVQDARFKLPQSQMKTKTTLFENQKGQVLDQRGFLYRIEGKGESWL